MNNSKCCANCFSNQPLANEINFQSDITGICSYCSDPKNRLIVSVALPIVLKEKFEVLINIYNQANSAKSLLTLLNEDWSIFSPKLSEESAKKLLSDILDDKEIVEKTFTRSDICNSDGLIRWKNLRNELIKENRFFLQNDLDQDALKYSLSHLIDTDEARIIWYRSRIQHNDKMHTLEHMGAPPPELASPGRANPIGIPYLYLASSAITAISEVRPHIGEIVNVAEFKIDNIKDLKIIDLRNPRKTVSPFALAETKEIALLRGGIELLQNFGLELTRPIIPKKAAVDYIPTQYLCEFIKMCGYHGVIYASSVDNGYNLALFYPDKARGITVTQHDITHVRIDYKLHKKH